MFADERPIGRKLEKIRQNQPRRIGVSFGKRDKIYFFGERRDEIGFFVSFLEILLFNLRNFPFHSYATELRDLSNIDTSSYEETAAAATCPHDDCEPGAEEAGAYVHREQRRAASHASVCSRISDVNRVWSSFAHK